MRRPSCSGGLRYRSMFWEDPSDNAGDFVEQRCKFHVNLDVTITRACQGWEFLSLKEVVETSAGSFPS